VRQKFVALGMLVSGDCIDGALDVGLPVGTELMPSLAFG
jgi:hypothetical protein